MLRTTGSAMIDTATFYSMNFNVDGDVNSKCTCDDVVCCTFIQTVVHTLELQRLSSCILLMLSTGLDT